MRRFFKDNGLTLVLQLLLGGSILGQWLTGWSVAVEDDTRHGHAILALAAHTVSPQFLASVFEHRESEFLQMAAYVLPIERTRLALDRSVQSAEPL